MECHLCGCTWSFREFRPSKLWKLFVARHGSHDFHFESFLKECALSLGCSSGADVDTIGIQTGLELCIEPSWWPLIRSGDAASFSLLKSVWFVYMIVIAHILVPHDTVYFPVDTAWPLYSVAMMKNHKQCWLMSHDDGQISHDKGR